MMQIYPSLMATENPLSYVKSLESYCAGFHLDLMDGDFVPNHALSIDTINRIDQISKKQSWVHLMVTHPEAWLPQLHLKEGSLISFHIESSGDHSKTIKYIKEKKWTASLALSPKTAIAESYPYLNLIDQILIMSVEPGYSGQHFLPSALGKVSGLLHQLRKLHLERSIALDGGITKENIRMIAATGTVNTIAIGSAIFNSQNPLAATKDFEMLCR